MADDPMKRRLGAKRPKLKLARAIDKFLRRDLPILPCDGERPMHVDWSKRRYTSEEMLFELGRANKPMIGLRLGRGSLISVEINLRLRSRAPYYLFKGSKTKCPPVFRSPHGRQYLFEWNEKLAQTGAAIVTFRAKNGDQIRIWVGAGEKATHLIVPPAPRRTWAIDIDEDEPPELPPKIIERILAAANMKQTS